MIGRSIPTDPMIGDAGADECSAQRGTRPWFTKEMHAVVAHLRNMDTERQNRMTYRKKKDAQREARNRTRLGYPHHVAEVTGHNDGCLHSLDHETPYRCTCDRPQVIGWSLVLGGK